MTSASALPNSGLTETSPASSPASAFSYLKQPQVLKLNVNETSQTVYVNASLGFHGSAYFQVDLVSSQIQTYSLDCQTGSGILDKASCADAPNNVTPYFNASMATPIKTVDSLRTSGYESSGANFNQSICVDSETVSVLCSVGNEQFYVAETLTQNVWNKYLPSYSGFLGFAQNSKIWSLFNIDPVATDNFYYTIEFTET
jgi:hypothetical protein